MKIERFQEGFRYRLYGDISGDCARLRFIRYAKLEGSGIVAGVFTFVEVGQTLSEVNIYMTDGYLSAVPRYGRLQPIVGFPGWPFIASMGKDVQLDKATIAGGLGVYDRAEIFPDGPLYEYPINDKIIGVDQLGGAESEFYRTLRGRGYLTEDDPMYHEIKHLL